MFMNFFGKYESVRRSTAIRYRERVFYQFNRGVTVPLRHGIGNKLLQYCFGRILAHRTQLKLDAVYVASHHEVALERPLEELVDTLEIDMKVDGRGVNGVPRIIRSYPDDLDEIDGNRPLVVCYNFFDYDHIRRHKHLVRNQWMRLKREALPNVPADNACVHIRMGDIAGQGKHLTESYYRRAIEAMPWNELLLITDEPDHPVVASLVRRYGARVHRGSRWSEDFKLIAAHKHIAICESSFSWWAAWLSDAELVVSPGPDLDPGEYGGYWSNKKRSTPYVNDESRYTFIN